MSVAFHGVIVYEITRNENTIILNGIYSNNGNGGVNDTEYEINNEIAKRDIEEAENYTLIGKYKARYIDKTLSEAELIIDKKKDCYYLEWFKNGKKVFVGIGICTNPNHLSVAYIKAN